MKNLIDFDEPPKTSKPDPIPTSKPKPKPDPIPTSKPIPLNKIMEKNLLDFSKDPYKKFTPNQNVKNYKLK